MAILPSSVGSIFQYIRRKRKFDRENKHNNVHIKNNFPEGILVVGKESYGFPIVVAHTTENKVYIGNYVSIARDVTFILNSDHPLDRISTFPFKVQTLKTEKTEAISHGDIVVDDDVWLGCGCKILSGAHIGQGAVIGAGAVVTKDVPPYAIVGGTPAKVIRYRFEKNVIKELLNIDYSKLTKDMISQHQKELYNELTDVHQIDWMPKKND